MRALIIYISIHHSNTGKIARAMADILAADLLQAGQADVNTLSNYDLVGFGSGIYFGRHHKNLFQLIDKLPPVKHKKAFVFSTSGIGEIPLINDFNRPLKKKLLEKGFDIAGVFSCRGFDTYGPMDVIGGMMKGRPNARDLKEAERFARALLEK